jgi:hypothetical protein
MERETLYDEIHLALKDDNKKKLAGLIVKKEALEQEQLETTDDIKGTYPLLSDPNFNDKIVMKKEFFDTKYDDDLYSKDISEYADIYSNASFELAPHQLFVRNFLSSNTPYNSLLVYHGLGTGKTCTAIGISENVRRYNNQMNIKKRIIMVASPNVQDNFKLQLFDSRRLKRVNGRWNINECVAQNLVDEILPSIEDDISREKLENSVRNLINTNYIFMGYREFGNYINRIKQKHSKNVTLQKKALYNEFSNRLIIIDEVHNIRINRSLPTEKGGDDKLTSHNLYEVVQLADNLKLLLLSATPLFNSYREIVWLINLMRANDKKSPIFLKNIFDKDGTFIETDGEPIGKKRLIDATRGYVSFVKGENPFVFPFRVYPELFNSKHSTTNIDFTHPELQINNEIIRENNKLKHLDLFIISLDDIQKQVYEHTISRVLDKVSGTSKKDMIDEQSMDSTFDLQTIDIPKRTLTMVYPTDDLTSYLKKETLEFPEPETFTGSRGLREIMKSNARLKNNYEYKNPDNPIFDYENIGKYSAKIKHILDVIPKSQGPIILYSEYIDGGCVPLALALESYGFMRAGTLRSNLLKKSPKERFDLSTNTRVSKPKIQAYYSMITGDAVHSPNNQSEMKLATNDDNKDGHKVKVIIISKAGSEGIDFKFIRQIHILEPWFNLGRIEQIIGRAVRFRSHRLLPLSERNTEIYMYATGDDGNKEYIDFYLYRLAEKKGINIGKISRALKENAIDCVLNSGLNELSSEKMNQSIEIVTATGKKVDYSVGSKPYTYMCDFLESCNYKCNVNVDETQFGKNVDTLTMDFINVNMTKLVRDIKNLFVNDYALTKKQIVEKLTVYSKIDSIQIDNALDFIVRRENNQVIQDMLGRDGLITNVGDMYLFQPLDVNDPYISIEERMRPVDVKESSIIFALPDVVVESKFAKKQKKMKMKIKKQEKKDEAPNVVESKDTTPDKEDSILTDMEVTYSIAFDDEKRSLLSDDTWMADVKDVESKITLLTGIDMKQFVIEHQFDILPSVKKLNVIKELISLKKTNAYQELLYKYVVDKYSMKDNIYVLQEGKTQELYKITGGEITKIVGIEKRNLATSIVKFERKDETINQLVGFMAIYRDNIRFKTKEMNMKRSKGKLCVNEGKRNIIKTLQSILDIEGYSIKYDELQMMKPNELCIMQELMLRFYESAKKQDKHFFFTLESQKLNNIEKKLIN